MKIGIIAAMSDEREQLSKLLDGLREEQVGLFRYVIGELGGNTLYIMECGIGKVNAAVGACEFIMRVRPDVIVSTGVAGGIDEGVGVMDEVAASEVVYHDVWCGMGNAYGQVQGLPPRFTCDARLVRAAASLPSPVPVHVGLICSGDKFVTALSELEDIKAEFPEGLAVDMESGAIAQVCHLYKVPFISFRVISDTPGAKEHWDQYENFWEALADHSFGVVKAFLESLPTALSEE